MIGVPRSLVPRDGDSDDVIIPNDAALYRLSRFLSSGDTRFEGGGEDDVGVVRPFRRS